MPKRLLSGSELALFIKERQAKQVRMLRQAHGIAPKLLILMNHNASEVIQMYVRMKKRYAEDILIDVEVIECSDDDMPAHIAHANNDESIHGIIVQLPLSDVALTAEVVDGIAPKKDVDGLSSHGDVFMSATAEAIDWLINGYGIELRDKKVIIVGQGILVGKPLSMLWKTHGLDVTVVDNTTLNNDEKIAHSDVIVSATGVAGLIKNDHVKYGAVVVDAGTVSEDGVVVGDVEKSVFDRPDVIITPQKGGVGPLTIVLLFDHVIRAALARIEQ